MPVAVAAQPQSPTTVLARLTRAEPPVATGPLGRALEQAFDQTRSHFYEGAQFWSSQDEPATPDDYDYVSPRSGRTFRFTARVRLVGRSRPAPYQLTDDLADAW